jgi:PhnB protein
MSSIEPIPKHLRTVTPRLVVDGVAAAIEFYASAFAAEEVGERFMAPDGKVIHAEVRIGDSIVMLSDDSGEGQARSPHALNGSSTAIIATYWQDVDSVWQRAVAAGAEVMYPLDDQFYGDRGGRLRDPHGHQWMLSQRIEELSHEELLRRAERLFSGE